MMIQIHHISSQWLIKDHVSHPGLPIGAEDFAQSRTSHVRGEQDGRRQFAAVGVLTGGVCPSHHCVQPLVNGTRPTDAALLHRASSHRLIEDQGVLLHGNEVPAS